MSMNRCVRVSSKVLLVPKRAATNDCTWSLSCSNNSLNASSFFAKAKVSLPVAGLIFIGGTTPNPLSNSANLGLDISSFLSVTPASINSLSLRSLTSSRCDSSRPRSKSSMGSVNIRRVASIRRNSCFGKPRTIRANNLCVRSTSFMQ